MGWFAKGRPTTSAEEKVSLGAGVFRKCDACDVTLLAEEFERALEVCPRCGHHARLSAAQWIELLFDEGSFELFGEELAPLDPLGFTDGKPYPDRVRAAKKSSGASEGLHAGRALLKGRPVVAGVFVFRFMGGSMGSVVGELITRVFEIAAQEKRPALIVSASGGARMQEGIFSLMQMAKTVAALGRVRAAGVPFVSVLTNPTTGGVAASYALLGDVNLAEPKALIGFAGPRVIETTIRQKLPEGFQRSEFLLEHGMVDRIVPRADMRETTARLLSLFCD